MAIKIAIWVFIRGLKSKSGYFLGFSKKISDEHTYHFYIKSPSECHRGPGKVQKTQNSISNCLFALGSEISPMTNILLTDRCLSIPLKFFLESFINKCVSTFIDSTLKMFHFPLFYELLPSSDPGHKKFWKRETGSMLICCYRIIFAFHYVLAFELGKLCPGVGFCLFFDLGGPEFCTGNWSPGWEF